MKQKKPTLKERLSKVKQNLTIKTNTALNLEEPPYHRYARIGLWIIMVFIGGFIFWASFTTIESAAVANGQVVAESKNKSIQHLEGGIIKSILVRDGTRVKKGQVLITLDVTKAHASLEVLEKQYYSLIAEKARLIAERDNKEAIEWPKELAHDERLKEIQKNILLSSRLTIDGQLKILDQQIKQLEQEIESYKAQLESETKQLALIEEEVVAVDYLYKRKLIELPKLLELRELQINNIPISAQIAVSLLRSD